jgi:LysR family transcriptional activator of glutamate synthase operon
MNLDYLCEFTVIAKLGSFSLAAEELYMSQSSLSKHIMTLEKELGVQLFNRTSRSVVLSEAGALILADANHIREIKSRMLTSMAEQINRQKRVVNIASITVMVQYGITGAIARFQKQYPEINLSVSEYESHQIYRLLETGECELAFNRDSEEESHILEYTPFCTDNLVAVLPRSHSLSSAKEVNLKQLADENYLFINKGSILYDLCFKTCVNSGFEPKIIYTAHRPENIIDLVSQGMGVSLLMKRLTDYFKSPGVACINVTPEVESTICLAKLKSRKLSSAAKVFWNYIKINHPQK